MESIEELNEKNKGCLRKLCSIRWSLAYIGIFGFGFVYATRINLSMAIVCMVTEPNNTETNSSVDTGDGCGVLDENGNDYEGEFDWSDSLQGHLLSSFFYGYMVGQVPSGLLAGRYGGKYVFTAGMLLTAVATVLSPVAARAHVGLLIFMRVLVGIGTAVSFPSMNAIWGRWAPPMERSMLITFTYAGTTLGNIVTLSTSGVLCSVEADGGWPLIFYIFGGGTFLWLILWVILVSNSPVEHPMISETEKDYIVKSIGGTVSKTAKDKTPVPWLSILKSGPVWAILVAHSCNNWGGYTLLTNLPTFMKDVLKYDFKSNGFLSSLPYIVQFFAAIGGGALADCVRQSNYLSTTAVRKIFQVTSFIGQAAFMIGAGFVECEQRELALVFLCISVGFTFGSRSGYGVNHVDIAPRFAGVLFGITNTIATIPGIIAPNVVSALTPNGTREEWMNVWFICAGFFSFGAIIYAIFASGEEQSWAKSKEDLEMEMNVKPGGDEGSTKQLGVSSSKPRNQVAPL